MISKLTLVDLKLIFYFLLNKENRYLTKIINLYYILIKITHCYFMDC